MLVDDLFTEKLEWNCFMEAVYDGAEADDDDVYGDWPEEDY